MEHIFSDNKKNDITFFVITWGLGGTLIYSKVKPLSNSHLVNKIYVFFRDIAAMFVDLTGHEN